jgi:hypothetical protein
MDRMGSVFGSGSDDRVHCRVLTFAMLNIQGSQILVGMFVICREARLPRTQATEHNFAFVNIFLFS